MKHTIIIIFLLMNCAITHSLIPMDFDQDGGMPLDDLRPIYKERVQATESLSNAAKSIDAADAAIKKNIVRTPAFLGMGVKPLTEQECLEVLKIAEKHCGKKITDEEIKDLRDKNDLFKEAIDYFFVLATNNLYKVTYETLDQISNVAACQPTPQLNWLSAAIKRYVMKAAADQKVYSYVVMFKGHKGNVRNADMHEKADLAASSGDDGTGRLWCLSTGEQLHIFPQEGKPHGIRFNDTGCQLAISADFEQNSRVNIYHTDSKKLFHTIDIPFLAKALAFSQMGSDDTLIVLAHQNIALYKLTPYSDPLCLMNSNMHLLPQYPIVLDCICQRNHEKPRFAEWDDTTWTTKNKSRNLYLYRRLLLNAYKAPSLPEMQKTSLYEKLNKGERKKVEEFLTQKKMGMLT